MRASHFLFILLVTIQYCEGQFGQSLSVLPQDYYRPANLNAIHVVDLTGDGLVDLIPRYSDSLGYYIGDGLGGFSSFVRLDLVGTNNAFCISDLDLDGRNDIVTLGNSGGLDPNYTVLWWRNGGAGTFGEADTLLITVEPLSGLTAGDLDGDGDPDLTFMKRSGVQSLWGMFLRNDGNGEWSYGGSTLPSINPLAFRGLYLLRSEGGYSEVIFDVDGGYTTKLVGDALIATPVGIPDGWVLYHCVDLNQDDLDDLVLYDLDASLQIMFRDPDDLGWDNPIALPEVLVIPNSSNLLFGDMDGDGAKDILLDTPGALTLFINNGTGSLFIPRALEGDLGAAWFAGYSSASSSAMIQLVEDVDSDGDLDAIGGYHVFKNDGTGTLTGPFPILPQLVNRWSISAFGDLNGDGLDDVLAGDQTLGAVWFKNLGNGTFERGECILPALTQDPWIRVVDMDGDGSNDVTYENRSSASIAWTQNMGNGQFGDPSILRDEPSDRSGIIDVMDIDSDGDGDVVYFSESGISTLINNGIAPLAEELILALESPTYVNAVVSDMDGDDRLDLVIVGVDNPSQLPGVNIVYNLGGGSWSAPQQLEWSDISTLYPVCDIDLDGDMDLIRYRCSDCDLIGFPDLAWTENLGTGNWGGTHAIFYSANGSHVPMQDLRFRDLDQDGDPDALIALGESTFGLFWAENVGGGVFAPHVQLDSNEWHLLQLAHLLGTSALDVVGSVMNNGEALGTLYMGNMGQGSYQIRGSLFLDLNENGQRDLNEPPVPDQWVAIDPSDAGANSYSTGEYVVLCSAGAHTVQPPSSFLEGGIWALTTPVDYQVVLTTSNTVSAANDFGITPILDMAQFDITCTRGETWCGGEMPIWITIKNIGTRSDGGTIRLSLDHRFTLSSFQPFDALIEDTTLLWQFDPLAPFQSLQFMVHVISPNVESMGTEAHFRTEVHTLDETGNSNGTFASDLTWLLECAYDPNDKQVVPRGYGSYGALSIDSTHVDFTIRFQNTGTATAFNIEILDQLAPELDRSRIQVLGSSHQISRVLVRESGEMDVDYFHIMLPDSSADFAASQGFVCFRIPFEQGLISNTQVLNSARIHFDLNPPITTNTTLTTLVDCDLWEPVVDNPLPDLLQATEGDQYQWFFNGEAIPNATSRWLEVAQLGSYSAQVTSPYGCTAMSGEVHVISLGVAQLDHAILHAVPNPFNNSTFIRSSIPITPDHTITLCDAQGRVVLSGAGKGGNTFQIERGRLSQGLYLVRLHSADNGIESTLRVIIE